MSEIKALQPMIFQHQMFGDIRGVEIDNESWLIGKDVALALDFRNHKDALGRHVDPEDKKDGVGVVDPRGIVQKYTLINESGMYSLALRAAPQRRKGESQEDFEARRERAKQFKRWVTHEVLPSIRKNGYYVDPGRQPALQANELTADFVIQLGQKMKEQELQIATQQEQIDEMSPKADHFDRVMDSETLYTATEVGAHFGLSAKQLNTILHNEKIIYKCNHSWIPYSKYKNKEYGGFVTKYIDAMGDYVDYWEWNQKGMYFIYNLLKDLRITHINEREFMNSLGYVQPRFEIVNND